MAQCKGIQAHIIQLWGVALQPGGFPPWLMQLTPQTWWEKNKKQPKLPSEGISHFPLCNPWKCLFFTHCLLEVEPTDHKWTWLDEFLPSEHSTTSTQIKK